MVTAMQPRTNTLPVAHQGIGLEGMETLDQQDLILPRKTIVQLVSKKVDGHYGEFHDNLTNECVPKIEAVILQVTKARTLWSGEPGDTKPECASYDGVAGRTYGACVECGYSPDVNPSLWEDKLAKHCKKGYLFLCVDRADGTMFLLGAMGTSVKPAKILISSFVNKKRPPLSVVVRFESQIVTDTNGKYYVLKPSIVQLLDASETAEYRKMYQAVQGVRIADIDPGDSDTAPVESGAEPF